jgi:hypothetical protein
MFFRHQTALQVVMICRIPIPHVMILCHSICAVCCFDWCAIISISAEDTKSRQTASKIVCYNHAQNFFALNGHKESIHLLFISTHRISNPPSHGLQVKLPSTLSNPLSQIIASPLIKPSRSSSSMPSKIQLDENLWFLYICLQKSDLKSVCPLHPSHPPPVHHNPA